MIEEAAMISEPEQVEKGFMKAIVRDRYGSPDVLRLEEVEKPAPNDVRGVLVKIYASSVNPADRYDVRGPPFLIRLVLPCSEWVWDCAGQKKPESAATSQGGSKQSAIM